jgi:hypothetical protein
MSQENDDIPPSPFPGGRMFLIWGTVARVILVIMILVSLGTDFMGKDFLGKMMVAGLFAVVYLVLEVFQLNMALTIIRAAMRLDQR